MPGFAAQPRDATLDALAALAWSSGTQVPALTAADTLSLLTVGTAANNLVRLDGSAKLPAVDGSLLTNLPSGGKIAQVVSTLSGAVATGTTQIPDDDTIPQNTEGTEFFTRSITPTNASSKLLVTIPLTWSCTAQFATGVALFVDSTASAVAAAMGLTAFNTLPNFTTVTFLIDASNTTARTYKVRIGQGGAGTITINGYGGNRKYGGVCQSGIIIAEILP